MKLVHDHRAKWLPSRHHYALSKLIAFAIFRYRRAEGGERRAGGSLSTPQPGRGEGSGPVEGAAVPSGSSDPAAPPSIRYAFAIDRNQSTPEAFTVAALVLLTTVADVAALLPFRLWVSLPLAIILGPWLLQVPLYAAGIPFGNTKFTSVFILTTVAIASSWAGAMQTPLRFVPWLFFAVLALNAAAWVPVRLLDRRMLALEQECGV
jgi:hypothetical protein